MINLIIDSREVKLVEYFNASQIQFKKESLILGDACIKKEDKTISLVETERLKEKIEIEK